MAEAEEVASPASTATSSRWARPSATRTGGVRSAAGRPGLEVRPRALRSILRRYLEEKRQSGQKTVASISLLDGILLEVSSKFY